LIVIKTLGFAASSEAVLVRNLDGICAHFAQIDADSFPGTPLLKNFLWLSRPVLVCGDAT
jgi:hypothetical protein